MSDKKNSGIDISGFGELEELFDHLVHHSPLGIFLYALDERDRLIFRGTNQAACDLLGVDYREMVGRTLEEAFPALVETDVPDAYRRLAKTGGNWEREQLLYDDGKISGIYSVYAFQTSRRQMAVVFQDISAHKKAERDLAQAKAALQAAIEATPAGVLIVEAADFSVRLMNSAAEAILGEACTHTIDPQTGEGPGWRLFLPGGMPYAVEEIPVHRAIMQGETVTNEELLVVRADEKQRHVLANAAPIRNAEGEITSGVAVFLDVTEKKAEEIARRNLQEQMQQAQKLESLGLLAGGIAHDFNNLLCAILGGADLATHELAKDHPAMEDLKMIKDTAQQATELCRQMLAYSGKGKFRIEPLNLSELIKGMAHLLKVSVSKKAALHVDTPLDMPTVEADAVQIRQIILNLVVNASEALEEESGVISVRTGWMDCDEDYLRSTYLDGQLAPGPYVFLEISDTGRGMDDISLTRLFDPFFTSKKTGRGLGLATVLGIVRSHAGSIKVYSELGKGTTFKVLLPASSEKQLPQDPSDTVGIWSGEGTVLLVDDEPTVREVGRRMLEHLGFNVLTACNGQEAVAIYAEKHGRIKYIILDMTMPIMSGQEAFRRIRAINPVAQVILTSGYNAQDATSHFAGKGLAGFIQKPFLIKQIRHCMAGLGSTLADKQS